MIGEYIRLPVRFKDLQIGDRLYTKDHFECVKIGRSHASLSNVPGSAHVFIAPHEEVTPIRPEPVPDDDKLVGRSWVPREDPSINVRWYYTRVRFWDLEIGQRFHLADGSPAEKVAVGRARHLGCSDTFEMDADAEVTPWGHQYAGPNGVSVPPEDTPVINGRQYYTESKACVVKLNADTGTYAVMRDPLNSIPKTGICYIDVAMVSVP
jgi:hypothetical protein